MPASIKLRDLIRKIRSARTAADERDVVQKECASIRSLFRTENDKWRARNVAKLLYIHLLGYQVHFAELECLKLIASSKFSDKRMGYLGVMLLLDEKHDIHLLVTNSLKKDLNSPAQHVVGLALSALGAICSLDMSNDLAGEIEKLLKVPNMYIRKKAALCAFRIVKKAPECREMFIPAARSLLSEKNHAVLITTVTLITEMCEHPDILHHYKKLVSTFTRMMKDLVTSSYSLDHDVCGINDPFLQVKLLNLLRVLGKNDPQICEVLEDVLAQVATHTDSVSNVGNAILYETALCIMGLKLEKGLRSLGINILGRFLQHNDRNIRYTALNTLLLAVKTDTATIQRYRNAIVESLKDTDISIKKRAMELCLALINSDNIKFITNELLIFLGKADPELKSKCSSSLFISAELYAPSKRWHIDTMIKVLTIAGNFVFDDFVSSLIQLISESSSLHLHAVQQLWMWLKDDFAAKQPLVQVAAWSIGEFGHFIVSSDAQTTNSECITANDIVDRFEKAIVSTNLTLTTKEYIVTALMKLSVRFPDSASRIKQVLDIFRTNIHMELQQRSIEFSSLLETHDNLRFIVLDRMPDMVCKNLIDNNSSIADVTANNNEELLKLEKHESFDNLTILDLLSDISETAAPELVHRKSLDIDPGCLLSSLTVDVSSEMQSQRNTKPLVTIFGKNSLKITFHFEKEMADPLMTIINVTAMNCSSLPISNFLLEVSVPKMFQLQMFPPTSNVIPVNNIASIKQRLNILNPKKSKLRMKLRVSYIYKENSFIEQIELTNIPDHLYR